MHENRVYYNLIDANAMLPRLQHLFEELARVQRQVNTLTRRAEELGIAINIDDVEGGSRSGHPVRRQIEERLMACMREYAERLGEIEGLGVIIDDLDFGIVNFYSWFEGKEIFLSWQFGEPEVGHWHAVTENSIARRSLRHILAHRPAEVPLH